MNILIINGDNFLKKDCRKKEIGQFIKIKELFDGNRYTFRPQKQFYI